VQGLVANEGDGWTWTTEELERYYEISSHTALPQTPEAARDHVGAYVDAAGVLGKRTAELHLALASAAGDPAFAPEQFARNEVDAMTSKMRDEVSLTFALLKATLSHLPDNSIEMAGLALGRQKRIIDRLSLTAAGHDFGKRIRIHGDYHLGQVLRTRNDFVILDFEGEPARPLEQRRAKYTPLKDVAGMLRSFSYAANSTLITYTTRHPEDMASLEPWARLWEQTVAAEFLAAYRNTVTSGNLVPAADEDFRKLLDACLLEKAMYELTYELNNRPTWIRIPLAGILTLAT
jgi:maltose alpha-D-glucosyltransferase/alpha-amylase